MENLPIGRQLAIVSRLHASRLDQFFEQIGLFRGQAILLVILSERDGQTHTEIANTLHISPAAATKVIKRLEKLGYLERCPDPADERLSRVFLRDEGRAVLEGIHHVFKKMNQTILDGFSVEERETLRGLMSRIRVNLEGMRIEAGEEEAG